MPQKVGYAASACDGWGVDIGTRGLPALLINRYEGGCRLAALSFFTDCTPSRGPSHTPKLRLLSCSCREGSALFVVYDAGVGCESLYQLIGPSGWIWTNG
jgi:hypothetical protein